MSCSQFCSTLFEQTLAVRRDQPFDCIDKQRQRGLAVGLDSNIGFGKLQIIGVVGLCKKVVRGNADAFRTGSLRSYARKIDDFDTKHDIRIGYTHPAACLLERMAVREVHPSLAIHDGSLKGFRELDHMFDRFRRAGDTVDDNHRMFGCDQEFGYFCNRCRIGRGRNKRAQFWNVQIRIRRHFVLLQFDVEDQSHGHHWRSHCDLICAHHRLGEVLERMRSIVPLGHVTN